MGCFFFSKLWVFLQIGLNFHLWLRASITEVVLKLNMLLLFLIFLLLFFFNKLLSKSTAFIGFDGNWYICAQLKNNLSLFKSILYILKIWQRLVKYIIIFDENLDVLIQIFCDSFWLACHFPCFEMMGMIRMTQNGLKILKVLIKLLAV